MKHIFESDRGYIYEVECEYVMACNAKECCSFFKFPDGKTIKIEDNIQGKKELFDYIKTTYRPTGIKEA